MVIHNRRACDLLFSAALLALATGPTLAQDSGAPPATAPSTSTAAPAGTPSDPQDEIVVVGTAGGGVRRQSASYAVTTLDTAAIERIAPSSTADLLRVVPGVSVESSGGQNGANIFVRGFPSGGDAEFVTFQQEGVPVFPPPTLSFLENSQLVRFDETVARVEAVRGGTGVLFGAGQPGLTVNQVEKRGGEVLHALAKISGTDFGTVRGDALVSGPVGQDTTALIGGFYAAGNGIRDPRFTAEQGGQIYANIDHKFSGGELFLYGRYLNDKGQWLLPIPINTANNGRTISGYPGFAFGSGTFIGPDNRVTTRNDGSRVDLADGRGAKIGNVGFNADYDLSTEVHVRDRFNWLGGPANTVGLVPAGTPTTAGAVAAGAAADAFKTFGTPVPATPFGALTYVTGGGVAGDATTPVGEAGVWTVYKTVSAEVNDGAFEWKHNNNTLTAGFYYAHTYTRDSWNLGNTLLLTLTPNARRLNLTLADRRPATRDGFIQGSFFRVNATYEADDYAPYIHDEFKIGDKLKIDGGFRWQEHDVKGRIQNLTTSNLDGNPNTLYDNNDIVFAPGFAPIRYRGDEFSGTAGVDYEQSRHLGAFARFSRGNIFPFFDNLRSGLTNIEKVDSYEVGIKATYPVARAYLTYFHNDFNGLSTTQITNGAPITSTGGARTNGVELEGAITPIDGLSLGFAATYLDAKYQNFFSNGGRTNDSGNQVQRQPRWAFRLAPSYERQLADTLKGTVFASYDYVGDRYSDVENQQVLPEFGKLDAGVALTIEKRLTLQVTADNLTNEIGLTEGNPRVLGSQGTGTIYARPILGRSFTFSATFSY